MHHAKVILVSLGLTAALAVPNCQASVKITFTSRSEPSGRVRSGWFAWDGPRFAGSISETDRLTTAIIDESGAWLVKRSGLQKQSATRTKHLRAGCLGELPFLPVPLLGIDPFTKSGRTTFANLRDSVADRDLDRLPAAVTGEIDRPEAVQIKQGNEILESWRLSSYQKTSVGWVPTELVRQVSGSVTTYHVTVVSHSQTTPRVEDLVEDGCILTDTITSRSVTFHSGLGSVVSKLSREPVPPDKPTPPWLTAPTAAALGASAVLSLIAWRRRWLSDA